LPCFGLDTLQLTAEVQSNPLIPYPLFALAAKRTEKTTLSGGFLFSRPRCCALEYGGHKLPGFIYEFHINNYS
jgi:hypothetical protein